MTDRAKNQFSSRGDLMILLLPIVFLAVCTAAPPPSNLVSNPRFASGLFDPDGWSLNRAAGNQVTWVCDAHDENLCAVQLVGSGADWAGASNRATPYKAGEVLTVAAWLKSTGVSPNAAHLYVRFWSDGRFLGQFGPAAPAEGPMWTLVSGLVTAPPGTTAADFSLQLWSRGTILLGAVGLFRDDIGVQASDLLSKPAPLTPVAVTTPRVLAPDRNHNGIADALDDFLAIPNDARSIRLTRLNTTCFQTPTGYRPDNDVKVDSILVVNETRETITSWQALGCHSFFMLGFRDGQGYVNAHPGSVQQTASGHLLDCGPGSYYMVPTADRRRIFRDRFRTAFENGAEAAAPEEPEYIGTGGYSPAFKKEFEAFYHHSWVAPHTSPQARVDCQRLMGHLEVELLRACYEGAHSVKPKAPCFMLAHSPLNYSGWGIMFPHYEAITSLPITDYLAQVWTGTARSAINHAGDRRERTFENAYLEYSSSFNLVRGMNIPVWLLMDPVEDNPDLPMEDYFRNYKRTLAASLMFPESDRYEVMPWPTRIFGRVPAPFATTICTIVNALADMQNHPDFAHDRGTDGIASFIADSAMWQHEVPSPADFDAIYGLTLPLLMRGVPVQLAHLDRVGLNDYLKPYRVLLVSFEAMKPARKDIADGLVAWVRAGGRLLLFGAKNDYDDLDLWWKAAGCASPRDYLLKSLGVSPATMKAVPASSLHVAAEARAAAVTEAQVGRGGVLVSGLSAAWFAKSPAADQMLRDLVRYASGLAGLTYREQGHIGIRRGPYVVVKAFDEETPVNGPMIDLMSPNLSLRPAGPLAKDGLVVLRQLPARTGEAPVLAASSACIEWAATSGDELRLVASGPSGVRHVLRLVTGGQLLSVTARDATGAAREVQVEPQGDTALLRFDSEPAGLGLRIRALR
jgi:hypothetical protein